MNSRQREGIYIWGKKNGTLSICKGLNYKGKIFKIQEDIFSKTYRRLLLLYYHQNSMCGVCTTLVVCMLVKTWSRRLMCNT